MALSFRNTDDKNSNSRIVSDVNMDVDMEQRLSKQITSSSEIDVCPLFMDSLPPDFASNCALAAIASLLDESGDGDDEKVKSRNNDERASKSSSAISISRIKSGGGKTTKTIDNKRRNFKPYDNENAKVKMKKASMGEAQLFLSMWKI